MSNATQYFKISIDCQLSSRNIDLTILKSKGTMLLYGIFYWIIAYSEHPDFSNNLTRNQKYQRETLYSKDPRLQSTIIYTVDNCFL